MIYQHGIPAHFRAQAASLYDSAFGAKLAVAIPQEALRIPLLADSLDLDFAFAAIAEEKLIGLAGYKTAAGSLTGGLTYAQLIRRLGWLRGNRAAIVLGLYERSMKAGELLMDGIVVDAAWRGRGVGTGLLSEIVRFATEQGYDSVRLDVIDTNPGARRLYERRDFVATKTESFGYLRWLLGFGASTTLVRRIVPGDPGAG